MSMVIHNLSGDYTVSGLVEPDGDSLFRVVGSSGENEFYVAAKDPMQAIEKWRACVQYGQDDCSDVEMPSDINLIAESGGWIR